MFALIDPPVYEQPIRIDFSRWLREKRPAYVQGVEPSLFAHAVIRILETEWAGDEPGERYASYEIDRLAVYSHGERHFATTSEFAAHMQAVCPLPYMGVNSDVNAWYNIANFAKQEAISWRAAQRKTVAP